MGKKPINKRRVAFAATVSLALAAAGRCMMLQSLLMIDTRVVSSFSVQQLLVSTPSNLESKRILFTLNHLSASSAAMKGFGSKNVNDRDPKKKGNNKSVRNRLQDSLNESTIPTTATTPPSPAKAKPFVKSEQDQLIAQLNQKAGQSVLGRAVSEATLLCSGSSSSSTDPFWELIPSLIMSKFPTVRDSQLERISGLIRHAIVSSSSSSLLHRRPDDWIDNPHRPHDEIHTYMPNLGPAQAFYDPAALTLCQKLSNQYDTIRAEYEALKEYSQGSDSISSKKTSVAQFQSVTSMNYDSGWQTLVLFYNGHRIPHFPYYLCPVTTRLMESVPLAGRIAGFNRQAPLTGIPQHTDGNNLWLTCQMGIDIPDGEAASITVGSETRAWEPGQCLVYDTTYQHETRNNSPNQERVVLHVDFFNTLALTPIEIQILQYVYSLREQFMKAEGIAKVGAQIL